MKLFMAVLFATLALNGVLSLPARTEDAEVIGGPRRVITRSDDDADDDDFTNFKGVIDTGSGYPFLQPNPSVIRVGFFDSFDDLFRRFSARIFPTGLFSRAGTDSDEDNSSELGFPAIDPKKANSTSTVKVVDGHKVEVNETVYGDENSVFKVRVVNIRPLEEGETVNETEIKDIKPVTQGPGEKSPNAESTESEEKREPLEKKPLENEIQGNIDEPEHFIAKKENIVETSETTTTKATATAPTTTIDTTMLPTTEDINAAFVTDNSLEQQEEEEYSAAVVEEELNEANGNGNNEFETNMSEDNNNDDDEDSDVDNDNIDNVENPEVEQHTIENNEDTEEEANDNLNESSSTTSDKEQENNNDEDVDENDADAEDVETEAGAADVEIINMKKKKNSAIRNKEREDESSSDDETDANVEMHPTFNDEWGSLNEPTNEQNDLSNDIDVYDAVPIDLSNDIAVNDAADLPINPDAEFIDVYGVQHQSHSMPKFEKLSLDYQPTSTSGEEWLNEPAK